MKEDARDSFIPLAEAEKSQRSEGDPCFAKATQGKPALQLPQTGEVAAKYQELVIWLTIM